MPAVKFLLIILLFPLLLIFLLIWIIYWKLSGKEQTQREREKRELKKKLFAHLKNFSPARLKNRRWINISKKKKKPAKSRKKTITK